MPNEKDWEALRTEFSSYDLLRAVDQVDRLRDHLNNDGLRPPTVRDDLLELHSVAMSVINNGQLDQGRELAELATDLEDQASDILHQAELLYAVVHRLVNLLPESVWDDEEPGPQA